jgi:glyoxylase-like metal-dependent hydrolase (beta-lactamase superfamily II)
MGRARLVHERVYQVGGSSMSDPRDCMVYLLVTKDLDLVLIDCGAGPSFDAIVRIIESSDLDPKAIKYLVLTHGHIDHIGAASEFVKTYGCKVIAHEDDLDAIEGRNMTKTAADWYSLDYHPIKVDTIIKKEEQTMTIGDLELHFLHTPGHTPGSMVVYLDIGTKRVLFGQDIHGPFDPSFSSDVNKWRSSMRKVLALKADILCEGHFGIYYGKDNVAEFINGHLEGLLE